MKFFFTVFSLLSLTFLACDKRPGVGDRCGKKCFIQLACSKEFRMLSVQVVDRQGAATELDSFVVVSKRDSKIIITNKPDRMWDTGSTNRYLLFSDSEKSETSRCGNQFEFRGYVKNKLVASNDYTIAHDCCHINLVSGDTKIVIED